MKLEFPQDSNAAVDFAQRELEEVRYPMMLRSFENKSEAHVSNIYVDKCLLRGYNWLLEAMNN